jgi:hypothetical protein
LRSNPKISVSGLGHHVGRPGKNTILYPPCGVPILRDLPTGIECVDWAGEEKKDEAPQKHFRDVELRYLGRATHDRHFTRRHVEALHRPLATGGVTGGIRILNCAGLKQRRTTNRDVSMTE